MFIDTHTHLCDPRFDSDREDVIHRAFEAGVEAIVEVAYHEPLWPKARALAEKYPGRVFWAAGLHPCHVSEYDEELPGRLAEALRHPAAVAVGEIGLDYYHTPEAAPLQKIVLTAMLETARTACKPVILHCRNSSPASTDAQSDLLRILKGFFHLSPAPSPSSLAPVFPGVAHCFQGSTEYAEELMGLGFLIGVDAPLTYASAAALREVVKGIPLESLLLETDCPYLPPRAHRGRRNEPANVREVASALAELKGMPPSDIAALTTRNARRIFVEGCAKKHN